MAGEENGTSKATLASLEQQVRAIDRAQEGTERALRELGNKFEAALQGLATKVDQRSTTQWPTLIAFLAVVITILGGLITILIGPIQRDTSRLDATVLAIMDRGVFQRGYESDQIRLTDALRSIRTELELVRVRSYEHQGEIATNKEAHRNTDARLDAISRRLGEFIRDMGKH